MEESGEQYTVVVALIVTESASECVCECGGVETREVCYTRPLPPPPPPPPLASSVTIYAKTTVH
jgi:hypothetical protein